MEIFAIVLLSVILAFIAGTGAFLASVARNWAGVALGVFLFTSACYLESLVIVSLPQEVTECIKEVK